MFHLLLLAVLLVANTAAEDLEAGLETDESAPPIQVYPNLDEIHDHYNDGRQQQKPYDVYLQSIRGYKGQSKVDRIVTELNNPDYIEPITLLDYRYVKTGGRDYTRGAGGQILILPKNVRTNQRKEFANYDELLEFLRLKQLSEIEAHHRELSSLGYENRQRDYLDRQIEINGRYQNGYQDQQYQRPVVYGGYKRDAAEPSPKKEKAE